MAMISTGYPAISLVKHQRTKVMVKVTRLPESNPPLCNINTKMSKLSEKFARYVVLDRQASW